MSECETIKTISFFEVMSLDPFYAALRIRLVEEEIVRIYPSDKIQSPVHLSIGQEHHIAVLCRHLKDSDYLFSSYRSHATYLARGGPLPLFFAELFGRITGVSKGKAGSMHLSFPSKGVMGSSAIVGATFSHAVGLAFAQKIKFSESIVVSVTGDGSVEEGTFYESLNLAQLLKVKVLFIIEDNNLAINSIKKDRQAFSLEKICQSFDIDFLQIFNGHSFEECEEKIAAAKCLVVQKSAPVLLSVKTHRYFEHVGIKPMQNAKIDKIKSSDPLILNEKIIAKYRQEILHEIKQAVQFAEESPFPIESDIMKDVY